MIAGLAEDDGFAIWATVGTAMGLSHVAATGGIIKAGEAGAGLAATAWAE